MSQTVESTAGEAANGLIARRVADLRRARNLSFDALSARCQISKGMLVGIEQGSANPSIGTLCKLAATLRVSLVELLEEALEQSKPVEIISPDRANVLWKGVKGGRATLLVSSSGPGMLELREWTLFPGEKFRAKKHLNGTVELLSITEGTLALEVDGVDYLVPARHRAVAMTDRRHAYRCHGDKRTRFLMVIQEPGET